MSTAARPKNEAFEKPPALATRSSVKEYYVSPELRSSASASVSRPGSASASATQLDSRLSSAESVTEDETVQPAVSDPIDEFLEFLDVFDDVITDRAEPTTTTTVTTVTVTTSVLTTALSTTTTTPALTVAPSGTMADAQPPVTSAPVTSGPAPPTVATPAQATAAVKGQESSFAPPAFHGAAHEDAESWLSRFEKYTTYRGFTEQDKKNFLAVVLRDDAADWYDSLPPASADTWAHLKAAFDARFKDSDLHQWQKASSMWNRVQGVGESVDAYITAMKKLARAVSLGDVQLRFAIQRGLRPELIGHVIQSQPTSVDDLIRAARIAEAAATATAAARPDASFDKVIMALSANQEAAEKNTEEMKRLANQMSIKPSINVIGDQSATAGPRSTSATTRGGLVSASQRGQRWRPRGGPRPPTWNESAGGFSMNQPQQTLQSNLRMDTPTSCCTNCGGWHQFGRQFCRARDVDCFLCGRRGHIRKMCRSGRRPVVNFAGEQGPPNFSA